MAKQPAANLWELSDLCTPWCVHVAASLHLAEHIAAGRTQIDELARAVGCDSYALHSLLGHLVSKGLFEQTASDRFALNELARGLLDPMTQCSLDLQGLGGRFAHIWSTLPDYLRTGSSHYAKLFGQPFWDDLDAHPQLSADFDALMGPPGHGIPNPEFQITGGWEAVRSVVDVGGGTGAMLVEILRLWPHLQGILVDLPRTVARSQEIFQAAGVADRVMTVAGSFFDPLPAGFDLYLLRGVLNDWPDAEALAILRRCAEAARPAGRLVVLKSVTPDESPRDLTIEMLLVGGVHRTVSQFRELAHQAGLQVSASGWQPSGYFVVECCPHDPMQPISEPNPK